jgi:hypothetical protein
MKSTGRAFDRLIERGLGVLLLFSPACVVESPVADRTRTAEQELSEDVDDWCLDVCERLAASCSQQVCDCPPQAVPPGTDPPEPVPPEDCECTDVVESPEECSASCLDSMAGFSDHGEACAAAGLESMACFDHADTCDEFEERAEDCFREPKHVAACNGGKVTCNALDGSAGGYPATSLPGGPGAAGNGGMVPSVPWTSCDYGYSDCSDGADYQLSCAGNETIACDCFRDGVFTNRFYLEGGSCYLPGSDLNALCGWNLADQ